MKNSNVDVISLMVHIFLNKMFCRLFFLLLFVTVSGVGFFAPSVYAADYGVEPGIARHSILQSVDELDVNGALKTLWGEPAEDSIMLGMWSYHFVDNDDSYQTNNQLFGISYKGYYAGMFKNSHDKQTWTLGFQREIYHSQIEYISIAVGYKAGIMYGYETMQLFDTKLFPLLQVYTNLRYKWAGVQLAWAGSVLTAGFVFNY